MCVGGGGVVDRFWSSTGTHAEDNMRATVYQNTCSDVIADTENRRCQVGEIGETSLFRLSSGLNWRSYRIRTGSAVLVVCWKDRDALHRS